MPQAPPSSLVYASDRLTRRRRFLPGAVLLLASFVCGWFYPELRRHALRQYAIARTHLLYRQLLISDLPTHALPTRGGDHAPADQRFRDLVNLSGTLSAGSMADQVHWALSIPTVHYFGPVGPGDRVAAVYTLGSTLHVLVFTPGSWISAPTRAAPDVSFDVRSHPDPQPGKLSGGTVSPTDPSTIVFKYTYEQNAGTISLTLNPDGTCTPGGTAWYCAATNELLLQADATALLTVDARPTSRPVIAEALWIATLPDGRLASCSPYETVIESRPGGPDLRTLRSRRLLRSYVQLSPDNTLLYAQVGTGFELFDLAAGELLLDEPQCLAGASAAMFRGSEIYVVDDLRLRRVVPSYPPNPLPMFGPGHLRPSMGGDGVVALPAPHLPGTVAVSHLSDLRSGRALHTGRTAISETVVGVSVSTDGRHLATHHLSGITTVHALADDRLVMSVLMGLTPRSMSRWSPDGRFYAAADDKMIILLDVQTQAAYHVRLPSALTTGLPLLTLDAHTLIIAPARSKTAFELPLPR